MRYIHNKGVVNKFQTRVLSFSTALLLAVTSASGAAPLLFAKTATAAGVTGLTTNAVNPSTANTCDYTAPFTVTSNAYGSDQGKLVVVKVTADATNHPAMVEWQNNAFGVTWHNLSFSGNTATYDPLNTGSFTLNNGDTTNFRAKFSEAGIYKFNTQIVLASDQTTPLGSPLSTTTTVSDCAVKNLNNSKSFNTLQEAIDDSGTVSGNTLELNTNLITASQVNVTKALTINGNGHSIIPSFTKTDNTNNSVIGLVGISGVTISNLIINGSGGTNLHGINAFDSTATLSDVTLKNNGYYGLVLNGSNVIVNNINTSNNTWGGIDADRSTSTSNSTHLTVNGVSVHAEANGKDIFIDNTTLPVTVTDTNTQYIQMNIGNSRVYTLGAPDTTKPAVPTAIMKDANNNVINNPGYINTKDFSFNISDSSSDVTQYKLRYWNDIVGSQYNGESHAWAPTSTNWDGHMNTLGAYLDNFTQGGGVHYFAFSACDAAGNCSDFSTPFTVTYDKIGPSAPSIITPGARQWFNTAPINTTWTAVSDISGINHYQVAYHYDDNHPFSGSTCSGDEINGLLLSGCRDTVSNSRNHNPGLGEEGGVTVWVRAIDNAGNVGPWSQSVNYFYDHTAPTGDISAPGNGLIVKSVNGKLDVSGSVNDNLSMNRVGVQLIKPGVSGQIQYLYDHMVNSNPGNWQVQFDTTGLGLVDGEYGLNVYFVDMAGNVTIKNSTFILDNSAPTVSIDSYVRNDDGTYTITGTTDDTANVIVTIPGDSNSPYTVAPISGVWSITTDPLTDGAYEVTATSTDSAGNEGTATPTPFRFTAAPTQQFAGRGAFLALAPINANIQAPLIVANAQVQPGVVLGNNTATPNITKVKGDSTDTPNSKVAASTTSKDGSKFLGLGWWWLLILAAILAFWWFLAAAKRRRDAEDA